MRLSSHIAVSMCAALFAMAPVRAADATFTSAVALKKPKKGDSRSGATDKVELKIFIPDGVKVVRGAVINPFYLDTIQQKHWQEACRLWSFALIGANYFGVQSNEFKDTLQTAMEDFATQSQHPELKHIPFCFNGMSAGAGMSRNFAAVMPERTLAVAAVCLEVAPDLPALRRIPFLTVFGEKDGGQMKLLMEKLPQQRKEDALWAIAVQWGRKHEYGQANNLVMPFFDDVIRERYPLDASPLSAPVKLADYPEKIARLGDCTAWSEKKREAAIFACAGFQGDKSQLMWFSSHRVAATWQAFVGERAGVSIREPAGQGDKQEFKLHNSGETLVVNASIGSNTPQRVELYDGDKRIDTRTEPPYEFPFKPESGIHPLYIVVHVVDKRAAYSRPHTIVVSSQATK